MLQVIVKEGSLKVGDVVLAGHSYGKIRAIVDDRGKRVDFRMNRKCAAGTGRFLEVVAARLESAGIPAVVTDELAHAFGSISGMSRVRVRIRRADVAAASDLLGDDLE